MRDAVLLAQRCFHQEHDADVLAHATISSGSLQAAGRQAGHTQMSIYSAAASDTHFQYTVNLAPLPPPLSLTRPLCTYDTLLPLSEAR